MPRNDHLRRASPADYGGIKSSNVVRPEVQSIMSYVKITVLALFAVFVIAAPPAALAQPANEGAYVTTENQGGDPGVGDPVDPADPGSASALPFTGGDIVGFVLIGGVLLGVGGGIYAISRRRRAAALSI